ncbi:hypothetical protein LCGC14_0410280 [marine sediment metagenome]|uniref:Uncharacterized protein n=1 Tax=marine sediment metagenome TaxID=412755 RepID=A0A0F9SZU6_9ZZZZ
MARPKARLSAQQQAIRKGAGPSANRKVLYKTHVGAQSDFLMSEAEEVLYGGAKGGGKSYALRAYAVNYCMSFPGARVVLFRQSYRQLEETHIISIQQEVPQSVAHYSSGSHDLIFTNGSILHLRYCEKDEDARGYDTAEFDAMLFDELTHFTEFTYTYLTTRCRSTKPWWTGPRIRAGATPLGRGHGWVKARWLDNSNVKPNEVWKGPADEGGMTRQFIPAIVTDNPTLMKADPKYVERLRALTREEYKAAMGNWDVFMGQFFQRWEPTIHVVQPFDIPADWDRFMCVDYGFAAPYCVLWFARPPGTKSAYFYREQYGVGVKLPEQVYRAHQSVVDSSEKIRAIILDPSMFGKINVKGDRVESLSAEWEKQFGGTTRIIKGNNERVAGWRKLREMIDWTEAPQGGILAHPHLYAFNTCVNLVRTLPLLISDEHNIEDVDSDGEDHAGDAARYGIQHAFAGGGRHGVQRSYSLGPNGIVVRR